MRNKKTVLLSIAVIPVFFSGLFASISPCKQSTSTPVTLEFWSVFDNSDVYSPLIDEYKQLYPNVTINYHKKDINTYEQELIDALAAGRGPDIFSIHNTWLPKHQDKLASAPASLITPRQFGEVFVDVVVQDFVAENQVYAFPLAVDTLALFYNKDLLNAAGIASPPKTWADFNAAVQKLTQRDDKNNITQAGAALGTARNINRSTDILAALMLQSGAKMVNDDKTTATFDQSVTSSASGQFNPGLQALRFYTNFANPTSLVYTWNQYQHYSLDAFVEGKAAMMINYDYQIPLLRARAAHLNFDVAPFPQISQSAGASQLTFANYWAQAVSKNSANQAAAWQFIAWLASQGPSREYLNATNKIASRRDLIEEQKNSVDERSVFANQALTARSWWEADSLAVEQIFADMIDNVTGAKKNSGGSPTERQPAG